MDVTDTVSQPHTLNDLDRVIDLYMYEDVRPGNPNLLPGGAGAICYYGLATCARLGGTELEAWVDRLGVHLAEHPALGEDFRVEFEGRIWRAMRDVSQRGTQISIRRLPTAAPALSDIRMTSLVRDLLAASWLNDGGLVLLCGLTGQGKTTVAGATIRTRLEKFGGRCLGVEDVAEVPLEGLWGHGSCRQLAVDYTTEDPNRRGFAGAIRRAYRSMPATRPAILFVGEVRDAETATEVVKAAANGMLVITTAHSYDPASALLRLSSLAKATMGDAADIALAQAVRMVMHMSLRLRPDETGWTRGSYTPSLLFSDGPAHALANLIRKANYAGMADIMERQKGKIDQVSRKGGNVEELLAQLSATGG